VLGERDRDEYLNVAAGLAVLAGIAGSDAICDARLGRIHRGDDHRAAQDLLQQATPDGKKLAAVLGRLSANFARRWRAGEFTSGLGRRPS